MARSWWWWSVRLDGHPPTKAACALLLDTVSSVQVQHGVSATYRCGLGVVLLATVRWGAKNLALWSAKWRGVATNHVRRVGLSRAAKKRSSYRPCLLQPSHVRNLGPVLESARCRARGLQHDTAVCARPSGPAGKLSAGHRAAVQHRVLGLYVILVRNGPASGDRMLSSA